MNISGSGSVQYAVQAQRIQQQQAVNRTAATQPANYDGNDAENDGDKDDGSVTATRGNTINISV